MHVLQAFVVNKKKKKNANTQPEQKKLCPKGYLIEQVYFFCKRRIKVRMLFIFHQYFNIAPCIIAKKTCFYCTFLKK
ncbi:hypothetical protein D1164_07505 [Mariniphaga sediminis]|uniref:Uncharacterized protein n=1 Tax=Mariniphaga sediminis TaxID=1628158 RepID=A0A399D4I7_9BACT|nr:hypothetical protein D1164_07505 [Mariniphaga sediminis]